MGGEQVIGDKNPKICYWLTLVLKGDARHCWNQQFHIESSHYEQLLCRKGGEMAVDFGL